MGKIDRGIYLLPNFITTLALFSGFYAVIAGMQGKFEVAAIAIFVAMLFDTLDGRVARMTNSCSPFGEQYDSMSDLVSFGVAPALLMYQWGLHDFGKLGWLMAFIYTAGAALRLARFNTQVGTADKRYFQGLPSPAAAALVAGFVWVLGDTHQTWIQSLALVVTGGAGLLMVSNVRYSSFKDLKVQNKVPFVAMLLLVLVIVLITIKPSIVLFVIFASYALYGLLSTLWSLRRWRSIRQAKRQEREELSAKSSALASDNPAAVEDEVKP